MISVVVPALNEEEYLPACLSSLKDQDYPGEYEVIVVDNGSSDRTASLAQEAGAKVLLEPVPGVAKARQRGFNAAGGQIIASTDSDTTVPKDWLRRIDRLFVENPSAVAVAGYHRFDRSPLVIRAWLKASLAAEPFALTFFPSLWNFTGANFAVRSDAFKRVGGFKCGLKYDEDTDLCRRLKRAGGVVFSRELIVSTSGRAFTRDHMGLGRLFRYRPRPHLSEPLTSHY